MTAICGDGPAFQSAPAVATR